MTWLWIVSAAALLLLLLLGMTCLTVHLYFSRREVNDTLWVRVTAFFGLIKFRYQMPVIRFRGLQVGLEVDSQTTGGDVKPAGTGDHRHITREKVQEFYADSKKLLQHVSGFDEWMKGSLARVRCTELRWETRVGLGDAPETAIACGLLWSVKSSLLSYMFRYIQLEVKPMVAVEPQYNKLQFSTEFSCIAKIRAGNAIIAGLLLLVRIMRVKGGLRTWQSILFKA